jgi:hypothetical protein
MVLSTVCTFDLEEFLLTGEFLGPLRGAPAGTAVCAVNGGNRAGFGCNKLLCSVLIQKFGEF